MMETRVKCRRCSAMILGITARINSGLCGPCARARAWRWRKAGLFVVACPGMVLFIAGSPLMWAYFAMRRWMRHLRFPFDRRALRSAIRAMHPPRLAASYFEGVIDGYWDSAPESFLFTRNQPLHRGRMDGGKLRRGEIAITDIPTHRERFSTVPTPSGVRHSVRNKRALYAGQPGK